MSQTPSRGGTMDNRIHTEVSIADETWRKGFVHLTVDGDGLVSLWDHEMDEVSYVKLELTPEQVKLIEETMKKGGATP